jgi:hypothetical protein
MAPPHGSIGGLLEAGLNKCISCSIEGFAVMIVRPRWADVVDSDEDAVTLPRARPPGQLPFYLILDVYLRGLFRRDVSRGALTRLQRLLRTDPRAASLPLGVRDVVCCLCFRPPEIRRQVRSFVAAVINMQCSPATARVWQAWLQLQTFYDPPTWDSLAYYLVIMHRF